jgi:hypothetical protein
MPLPNSHATVQISIEQADVAEFAEIEDPLPSIDRLWRELIMLTQKAPSNAYFLVL